MTTFFRNFRKQNNFLVLELLFAAVLSNLFFSVNALKRVLGIIINNQL